MMITLRPHRRPRQLILAAILVPLLLAAQGCKDDAYTACAKASADISSTVKTGIDTVQTLYTAPAASDIRIDKAERDGVLAILGNLTDLNIQFRSQVRALHAHGVTGKMDYLRVADGFVSSGQALLQSGALHVKNQAAQDRLNTIFETVKVALNGIALAVQNAKA